MLASNERTDRAHFEAEGSRYAISTQAEYSTKAAQGMLEAGGNIIDAAVAASFTLAVERPHSTGLSGGGFLMYFDAKTGKTYAIDFRERTPKRAFKDMYLDKEGHVQRNLSRDGILAVAVPGVVAGLTEIHHKFGSLPLAKVMAPAIDLAEHGFAVYPSLAKALKARAPLMKQDPAASAIFLDPQGEPWPEGHILVQKDLAESLKRISQKGRDGFYKGMVANNLVQLSHQLHGIIEPRDLKDYEVHWREPVTGNFHGYQVLSMPPPSSGGVHVIEFLNTLEKDDLRQYGVLSAPAIHLAASALQMAFADRAQFLGDPDFGMLATKGLTSPQYAQSRRQEISMDHARKADEVKAGNPAPYESSDTTHFSIIDHEGNAVASTQTINGWMGAGIVIPHTGIVLNNEMDDFSAQVGAANMFGAIGGKPNAIEPGKTPLSSMSPTFLMRDGQVQMSVGAPGGTRIISCVAQTILNYVEFKLPLYESVAVIRYHHQWKPDILEIDPPGPTPEEFEKLKKLGYDIKISPIGCNVMAVTREGTHFHAVADPRDIGTSAAK